MLNVVSVDLMFSKMISTRGEQKGKITYEKCPREVDTTQFYPMKAISNGTTDW